MVRTREILIIVTFFSLWLTNYFNSGSQSILAFALLFSVGLLHGSNDLQLLRRTFFKKRRSTFYTRLGLYLAIVAGAFMMFFWFPLLALGLFILVSGYHFGEQHWDEFLGRKPLHKLLFMCYGQSILFLLFLLNPTETKQVILQLTGFEASEAMFQYGLLAFGITFLLILAYLTFNKLIAYQKVIRELFLLLVFTIVFYWATLVWAFTIYFIFWHSIPSIREQVQYLYGKVNKATVLKYFKGAALVWVASIIGLLVFLWIMQSGNQSFLTIFFSFLGAITFAHTVIIARMFDQQE